MKALSIRQPWAWLIVYGYKDIENRTWSTSYRGPLLIHAGKKLADDASHIVWDCEQAGIPLPSAVHTGGIVGVVDLVDIVTHSPSTWFTGPHGWVLANARPLSFAPLRGRLGLFEADLVPEDLK